MSNTTTTPAPAIRELTAEEMHRAAGGIGLLLPAVQKATGGVRVAVGDVTGD
jgi:hypothetical protein